MADHPDYEDLKVTTSFSLTEFAREKLQELTEFFGLKSRSDFLERLSRGRLKGGVILNNLDADINIEAIEFYINYHTEQIKQEEQKVNKDEEFVLLQGLKIAHLKLVLYRLKGDGQNAQVDSITRAYSYLENKINLRRMEQENEFDVFGEPIKKKGSVATRKKGEDQDRRHEEVRKAYEALRKKHDL